ncbi:hypothetical protein COCON_G00143030 [Conger conger]|uniref:Uncharacterized protein n=1 Tax=Conger conger TaxID=82655 RepID=A0A9Q1HVA0_CONCO|nr:hypothetical protein COCON_G00143030 [Conger conger]
MMTLDFRPNQYGQAWSASTCWLLINVHQSSYFLCVWHQCRICPTSGWVLCCPPACGGQYSKHPLRRTSARRAEQCTSADRSHDRILLLLIPQQCQDTHVFILPVVACESAGAAQELRYIFWEMILCACSRLAAMPCFYNEDFFL